MRILADNQAPPERTASQMLTVLTKIVNRKVESLNTLTKGGTKALDAIYDDDLAKTTDLVLKLAREERMGDGPDLSTLNDEQILALNKQKRPNETTPAEQHPRDTTSAQDIP